MLPLKQELDYSKLETWQTLSLENGVMRISDGYFGAAGICLNAVKKFSTIAKGKEDSVNFLFNFETKNLRGKNLYRIYMKHCKEEINSLIELVLKTDKVAIESILKSADEKD